MFVKILPYYQLCAGCCMKFLRTASCENVPNEEQTTNGDSKRCNNNNNSAPEENGHSKELAVNGIDHTYNHSANGAPTNHDRTRAKENVFERVIRQPPEFIRICCWCFVRRRNESLSPSPDSSPIHQTKVETPFVNGSDEVTNVVLPLDGGTVYTPMKNFIGREVDDGCHVVELEELEPTDADEAASHHHLQEQGNVESPRSSSTGTDERLTNGCSTASTVAELETVDGIKEK